MNDIVKIEGKEYNLSDLSEETRALIASLKKVEVKILDHRNLQAVLTRAKKSYIDALKREALSKKAGFDFLD